MAKIQESPALVALVQATAGATGGVVASLLLQPLEVVKTQMQISQTGNTSMLKLFTQIFNNEGIGGLFKGVGAKTTETGAKNFVYFYIYDALNTLAKDQLAAVNTPLKLVLGFIAGMGTTTATMPLEVMATRLSAAPKGMGFSLIFDRLIAEEGVAGLWKGFWFNMALCINPAIQNTCFDKFKEMVLARKALQNPKARAALTPIEAFVLGALAKAVATVITFPLVRLKTMLQAGKVPHEPSKPPRLKSSTSQMIRTMSFTEDQALEKQLHFHRIGQLYRGLNSALFKTVLQAAFLYMTKDQVEGFVISFFKVSTKMIFRRKDGKFKLGAFSGRALPS